jgi:hypothetical protein
LLKQTNPNLDDKTLDNIKENAMEVESGASTSMHVCDLENVIYDIIVTVWLDIVTALDDILVGVFVSVFSHVFLLWCLGLFFCVLVCL